MTHEPWTRLEHAANALQTAKLEYHAALKAVLTPGRAVTYDTAGRLIDAEITRVSELPHMAEETTVWVRTVSTGHERDLHASRIKPARHEQEAHP